MKKMSLTRVIYMSSRQDCLLRHFPDRYNAVLRTYCFSMKMTSYMTLYDIMRLVYRLCGKLLLK